MTTLATGYVPLAIVRARSGVTVADAGGWRVGATFSRMDIGDALRRLDDRVLGAARPETTATYRNIFFVGLVGTLAVLIVFISTGESTAFAGVGGFVAFMVGGGVRWRRARQGRRG